MIALITERRIGAIFDESAISPRSVDAVMAGCKNRGFDLKRGGTLYSDALGGSESGADTYEGMVLHNVTTIKNALK
jgi:manganese/zinc/iron transport system substrate-binding protein